MTSLVEEFKCSNTSREMTVTVTSFVRGKEEDARRAAVAGYFKQSKGNNG